MCVDEEKERRMQKIYRIEEENKSNTEKEKEKEIRLLRIEREWPERTVCALKVPQYAKYTVPMFSNNTLCMLRGNIGEKTTKNGHKLTKKVESGSPIFATHF